MTRPVNLPVTFGPLLGPISTTQLDQDFTTLASAINDITTTGLLLTDTSGAAGQIVLQTPAGLTASLANGTQINFVCANTSASGASINLNGLGATSFQSPSLGVGSSFPVYAGYQYSAIYNSVANSWTAISNVYGSSSPLGVGSFSATSISSTGAISGPYINLSGNGSTGPGVNVTQNGTAQAMSVSAAAGIDVRMTFGIPGIAGLIIGFNNSGATNSVGVPNNYNYFGTTQAQPVAICTNALPRLVVGSTGQLTLTTTTATTATAGGGVALPSTVLGFITAIVNTVTVKIPYYAN